MTCPNCQFPAAEGAANCARCGSILAEPVPDRSTAPCRCGAPADAADPIGFCSACGMQRSLWLGMLNVAAPTRSHVELEVDGRFGAVSDIGHRYATNQDAVAIWRTDGPKPISIIAISDGVSTATLSEDASELAANTVIESLRGLTTPARESLGALGQAIRNAHKAVCDLMPETTPGVVPPGTTIAAAYIVDNWAVVGWVGDTRVYVVHNNEATLVTHDHSWMNAMVDSGQMTLEEARAARQSHVITSCLGPLNGENAPEPSVKMVSLTPGDLVIVCTDGLWNYTDSTGVLNRLTPPNAIGEETSLSLCQRLVEFALGCGGHDNISVAVLRV